MLVPIEDRTRRVEVPVDVTGGSEAPPKTTSEQRAPAAPQDRTLLDLVWSAPDPEPQAVVASVVSQLESGRVRLCGNFRAAPVAVFRTASLAWLVAVWLLGSALAGSAEAHEVPGALQNHAAWAQHDASPRGCEDAYRSFRVRNTQSPSQRRDARARCLEAAVASGAQKNTTEREVARGE